jgi:hypothetical protein
MGKRSLGRPRRRLTFWKIRLFFVIQENLCSCAMLSLGTDRTGEKRKTMKSLQEVFFFAYSLELKYRCFQYLDCIAYALWILNLMCFMKSTQNNSMELSPWEVASPLLRNLPIFNGNWRLITVFIRACHWPPTWARWNQSIPPHPTVTIICFLNLYTLYPVGLPGQGISRRKVATYTQCNTNRINAHRHPCHEWDLNPWLLCLSGRTRVMPLTARPLIGA